MSRSICVMPAVASRGPCQLMVYNMTSSRESDGPVSPGPVPLLHSPTRQDTGYSYRNVQSVPEVDGDRQTADRQATCPPSRSLPGDPRSWERTSHMNTPFCYIQCTRRHTPCNQQPATSGRGVRREAGTGDGRIGDGAASIRSLSFVGQSCYRYRYRVTGVWRLRCTWLWTRIECRPGSSHCVTWEGNDANDRTLRV